jgi:serine/threonine protein kinase/tetratricopeptide (TPR) repeat protein
MADSEPSILALAAAVADGSQVDWDQAESGASTPEERAVISQLRKLAAIGSTRSTPVEQWGPLEIIEEIGHGSFGSVFLARDPRLGREVALKLLHVTPLDQRLGAQSIAEGRLLAQIRHPNVVTVHGADQHDDRVGVWMEFVHGRTLKAIVEEHGPFGSDEAALIGRDICRALAAVHKVGFLHRDVKAQNVMREAGGRTVLMDFGAGDRASGNAAVPLMGTPAYLAPELFAGAAPTVASDVYSVGVLLYFLVSGKFPVPGQSLDDLRASHAAGRTVPLVDVRPDLPSAFLAVVDVACAADPAKRPSTAGAMAALLERCLNLDDHRAPNAESEALRPSSVRRWLPGRTRVVAVIALAALIAGAWMVRSLSTPLAVPRNSVAILPFESQPVDPAAEYLGEGFMQDVAATLGSIRDLRVVAGVSTMRFRNASKSPREIGAEVGVAAVLTGAVRRRGDALSVFVQLIDTASGEQIWSERFERTSTDVLAMQQEISRKTAIALRGELSERERERLRQGEGRSFEAFNLYWKGRHAVSLRTAASMQEALGLFREALALDARFAAAQAGTAEAYLSLGTYGVLPRTEAYARAASAAEQAIALDATLPEAYAVLAYAHKNRWEWAPAEANFKRAIELQPGRALSHHWYSIFLTQLGRFPEAIVEISTAISLDPQSVGAQQHFATVLLMARRFEDAITQWQHAIQLEPGIVVPYRGIAQAYAHLGLAEKARATIAEAVARAPRGSEDQELKADRGFILARAGEIAEARKIARELEERHRRTGEELAGAIAGIYAGLGDANRAFPWLERAVSTKDPELGFIKVDPRWDSLREDARFERIVAALALTQTHK